MGQLHNWKASWMFSYIAEIYILAFLLFERLYYEVGSSFIAYYSITIIIDISIFYCFLQLNYHDDALQL